jgi:FixJ family two-component response regulator
LKWKARRGPIKLSISSHTAPNKTAFLFTDVQTPGPIDGIDLARLVKTRWPHVEVLVTSGRPVSNIVLPDGVRFTSKPWSRKDVLELARAAVAA